MRVRVQKLASMAVSAIGIALLAMMAVAEGEPGAIPLLLVLVGIAGYVGARLRERSAGD